MSNLGRAWCHHRMNNTEFKREAPLDYPRWAGEDEEGAMHKHCLPWAWMWLYRCIWDWAGSPSTFPSWVVPLNLWGYNKLSSTNATLPDCLPSRSSSEFQHDLLAPYPFSIIEKMSNMFPPLPSTAASSRLSVSKVERVTGSRRMVSTLNSLSCAMDIRLPCHMSTHWHQPRTHPSQPVLSLC